MPIFCFNFNFIFNLFSVASFSIYIFLLNNFIFFIFVLCSRLQCQHSCQYFVWTLISFFISFSMSIFLFNNFILYYFCCYFDNCNVDTHANIQPRGQLSVHMYCLYWLTVQLLRDCTLSVQYGVTNQIARSKSVHKQTHRQAGFLIEI